MKANSNPPRPGRPVSMAQIFGIIAATLVLFFVVAFAAKALDAYRLRNWRERLQGEITSMKVQRAELQEELKRRQSDAWVEQMLRDAGQLPGGMVSVVAMTATPAPAEEATPTAAPTVAPVESHAAEEPFNNPNWEAWRRLIWGFD